MAQVSMTVSIVLPAAKGAVLAVGARDVIAGGAEGLRMGVASTVVTLVEALTAGVMEAAVAAESTGVSLNIDQVDWRAPQPKSIGGAFWQSACRNRNLRFLACSSF